MSSTYVTIAETISRMHPVPLAEAAMPGCRGRDVGEVGRGFLLGVRDGIASQIRALRAVPNARGEQLISDAAIRVVTRQGWIARETLISLRGGVLADEVAASTSVAVLTDDQVRAELERCVRQLVAELCRRARALL